MMVYKDILRYRDYRYSGLNMIRKGWIFVAQADRHPSYFCPKNAISVYYFRQSCIRIATIECDRFGGQQSPAAHV